MFSTVLASAFKKDFSLDENLIKHKIINAIRAINVKHRQRFGEMIIAYDSFKYWRKEYFPHYKAHRKKQREDMAVDWPALFKIVNSLKEDLKNHFPYKYIEVEGAEADDIIGVICKNTWGEEVLIVSRDEDFIQLQTKPNIFQYNPFTKKIITGVDPVQALWEHIVRGDRSDGIPNIRSPGNCFVLGERQKKVTPQLLNNVFSIKEDSPLWDNYQRNKNLIDLNCIPEDIKIKIIECFEREQSRPSDRSKLFNYFISNKMAVLMQDINDF